MRKLLFGLFILTATLSYGQRDTLVEVGFDPNNLGGDSKKSAYEKINDGFDYSDERIDSSKAIFDYSDPAINVLKYLDYNLEDGWTQQEGRSGWNDDDKTLEIGLDGGSVLQLGQEVHLRCTNNTGAQIDNGQVVYISGAQGNRPTIALANNNNPITAFNAVGIATQDIANNGTGYVTMIGLVRDVDTSAGPAGYVAWVDSTNGDWTVVRPGSPLNAVVVGVILRSHATEGIIGIRITTVPRLAWLSDVSARGTQADEDVLYWDNDSSKWKPGSVDDLGSAGYGEMGNTSDATEVIATADQWFAMFHANINASAPHLNDQFTFMAGSEGVIASSSTGAGSTVTFTDAAHGLLVGDYITINGTTSYNDAYVVLSKTDDTFTITETNSTGNETGLWQMGSYLVVSHSGVYRGVWNTSFKQSDNAARTSIIAPFINTTASTKAAASRYLSNTTDIGSIGGNGLMSFTVGDRIWFACQSTDPQTLTFTIRNVTIH